MEDSPAMTIEYLRARLLTERSVSKAAKERADELAERVKELEDQLKVVILQRRRAEKGTLAVLSYLESHGVSDISDMYESESDQEESLSESNVGRSNTTKVDENFGSLESKANDKESSGSDLESAPSSPGSLSWRGRKMSTQLLGKKHIDSPIRKQTGLCLINSSPRHRFGKSCRQIKRREMRSAVEESRHDSTNSDVQGSSATMYCSDHHANCLDSGSEGLKQFPERRSKKDELFLPSHDQTPQGASSSNHERDCNGEMERALKHQAQLMGLYEAHEKAQRDWEEKYNENNISTPDSFEPGNQSDVTEERDENKASVPNQGEIAASHSHDQNAGTETNIQRNSSSVTHFNSFKLSLDADTGCLDGHNMRVVQSCRSPASDFAFPTVNSNQSHDHAEGRSSHAVHTTSCASSALCEPHSGSLNEHRALVPCGTGFVLNALQEAKLLIKQQMNSLPESSGSVGRASEASVSATKDVDWLKIPIGCPGLFRVPIDLRSQPPIQSRALASDNPPEYTNSSIHARAPYLQGDQNNSSPMDSWLSTPSGDTFSRNPVYGTEFGMSSRPRSDPHFVTTIPSSSKSSLPSYSSSPDLFPRISSSQVLFGQFQRSEAGIPPSGSPLSYYQDVRPNMYR